MSPKELRALLTNIAAGDRDAFEALYHEISVPVFTVFLRITRNRDLSEDLLQEFFLKVFRTPPAQAQNPRAYLFRMAHNLALDALRQKKSAEELPEVFSSAGIPYTQLELELAFAALPLPERQIAALHLYAGLKFREIAEICGMSLGTVLWRYRRAISQLQTYLNGGCE